MQKEQDFQLKETYHYVKDLPDLVQKLEQCNAEELEKGGWKPHCYVVIYSRKPSELTPEQAQNPINPYQSLFG